VFDDVQRLVENLIRMNAILRNRESSSIRLVMNPDRMVIKEAQRTFTYLNLYGYLTDAVIVNRVFPEDVEGGYFGPWRSRQREHLEQVREGFAPVPVLTARYFEEEVMGEAMLDRLAAEVFADRAPEEMLHTELAHELSMDGDVATLRLPIPFTEKAEIDLKKVGDELIVAVGGEKRTIILPAALADQRPSGASFEGGTLKVTFDDVRAPGPQPERV
jgi:arsenite-transporting ATPase